MPTDRAFAELMAHLQQGDPRAAQEIFARYSQRLVSLAHQHLGRVIRQKVDPEDVVQSVFRSFFTRNAAGQFDLGSWDSLWGMLTRITLRKCGRKVGHFRAQRRDARREVAVVPHTEADSASWEALAREPTPAEAAILAELTEQVARSLDAEDRTVFLLSLEGKGIEEVAKAIGRGERTVYRALRRIERHLEKLQAAE